VGKIKKPYRLTEVEHEGVVYTLQALSEHLGWPLSTVIRRHKLGQDFIKPRRKLKHMKHRYGNSLHTVKEITELSGMAHSSVRYRIKKGLPLEAPASRPHDSLRTLLFTFRDHENVPLTYITHPTRLSIDLMRARLKRGMPPTEEPGGAFYNPDVLLTDSPTAKIELRFWGYLL